MLRLRGHTDIGSTSKNGNDPGTILKFRKGEIVYAQGDPATDWFEVMSGTVRTCLLYSDGHRQLTGFFYPGDVFGIDRGRYASSAEAVTAVTLRRCGRGFGEDIQPSGAPPMHGALRSALDNAHACLCSSVRARGTSFILPIGKQKDGTDDQGRTRYSAQAQGAAPC
jgi:hypothetical protein